MLDMVVTWDTGISVAFGIASAALPNNAMRNKRREQRRLGRSKRPPPVARRGLGVWSIGD